MYATKLIIRVFKTEKKMKINYLRCTVCISFVLSHLDIFFPILTIVY
jgi:hypothetical protein